MKSVFLCLILSFTAFFILTGFTNYDIPSICMDTTHKNLLSDNQVLNIPVPTLETGSPQDIYNAIVGQHVAYMAPWLLQDVSHLNIAEAAFLFQGYFAQNLVNRFEPNGNIQAILENATKQPAHYSQQALSQAQQVMTTLTSLPESSEMTEIKEDADLLCAPYLNIGCPAALRDTIDLMAPRVVAFPSKWNAYVSLFPVVQRILEDDGLVQGSAHFALKILDRIKKGEVEVLSETHLLADIMDSFTATGSTPAQAEDRAWTLLGMYGTRGASLSVMESLPNQENMPVFLSLYLFSSALAMVDNQTLQQGTPYSYPDAIDSRCAYHGPYHFWLAAYLSRALRAKGHSARNSVLGPHIMSKLYEFGSDTVARNSEEPYREPFMNPYNIQLQMDMVFTDGGSFFGAAPDMESRIPLDEGLQKILQTAKPMPSLTPDQLAAGLKDQVIRYSWFNRVIAPDAWLDSVLGIEDDGTGNSATP